MFPRHQHLIRGPKQRVVEATDLLWWQVLPLRWMYRPFGHWQLKPLVLCANRHRCEQPPLLTAQPVLAEENEARVSAREAQQRVINSLSEGHCFLILVSPKVGSMSEVWADGWLCNRIKLAPAPRLQNDWFWTVHSFHFVELQYSQLVPTLGRRIFHSITSKPSGKRSLHASRKLSSRLAAFHSNGDQHCSVEVTWNASPYLRAAAGGGRRARPAAWSRPWSAPTRSCRWTCWPCRSSSCQSSTCDPRTRWYRPGRGCCGWRPSALCRRPCHSAWSCPAWSRSSTACGSCSRSQGRSASSDGVRWAGPCGRCRPCPLVRSWPGRRSPSSRCVYSEQTWDWNTRSS